MQIQLSKHPTATLDDQKASAKWDVDRAAGRARSRYITVVPGQAETYQSKAMDAAAFLATSPDPAAPAAPGHPWVEAEAEAQGMLPVPAAQFVLQTQAQWASLGALIEKIRLQTKNAVTASGTIQAVIAARNAGTAALDAL
jgi:hypothetical protein